ncbi:MAG: hypothetical protein K8R19_13050 [Methanosarcinales archaeon]|nr:hypothetical protein [Methanosarcinales archaeon]
MWKSADRWNIPQGCLGSGSFEEIWRGGFVRRRDAWFLMRALIVLDDEG